MFNFSKKNKIVDEFRIKGEDFNALISSSVNLASNLEDIVKHARIKCINKDIQQSDIEELISKLNKISAEANKIHHAEKNYSEKQDETVWDSKGYAQYVTPSAMLLTAPDTSVKSAMDAIENGVLNATLIYELMLAEIDVLLQRWRISVAAGINNG